jgi:hypothetical protein
VSDCVVLLYQAYFVSLPIPDDGLAQAQGVDLCCLEVRGGVGVEGEELQTPKDVPRRPFWVCRLGSSAGGRQNDVDGC